MSELTLFLIRIGYLAILWIFVLAAVSVVRADMFGARAPSGAATKPSKKQPKQQPARRRGSPTHVLVVQGTNAGARAELDGRPILIGRGTDAAIRLDDDYASTRHARIVPSGEQWFVEDLGSTNGTYVGSARVSQPTTLTLGTQVRIGKTILELRK
ncbi:FHA domain-containing protein [Nocardioides zeae]|uniref:FHA domain-containing protein n=1 Tax=Nocardioides imazamoxiresistens TaxID=3231893 RepID=A0ABU3PUY3_9ACTN|nr:FHA domain-containing protein [Nocardioides zeae]MDT9593043.1 FHA domain-containing protein [Nocardioides zeae]